MFERASAKRRIAADPRSTAELVARRELTQSPTSGKIFVGRRAELRYLTEAVDAASMGHGSLVAVIGEPGIGKTALCEQVSQYAVHQGARVLVGYSYQRDMSPPYLPFAQILHRFEIERDLDDLRNVLGSNATEVARIVPDLRVRPGMEPRGSSGDPNEDRLRLFQAVSDFLCAVADRQALMLIFEDLHDADHGTLDLLLHLARNLQGAHILVVGTYRDVEVDRAHPLSAALAELHRVSQFDRMHLGELSVDDVQRLLESISERTVPRPLAELIHRRTGGNALFAQQLLRFLLSERLLEERDGALHRVGDETLAGHMPEALRDVVGKRLSRMSSAANKVLTVASVIGREFQLEVLQRVYARSEEELESALEEAVAAGLVEERSVVGATITYRFSHAFFQQTLHDEILAPRRIRLHQQIARVAEDVYARRLDEHAAELAEHYAFSSDTSDQVKAIHYAELAAKRATEVFAYKEAAGQLERALAVQDLAESDDPAKRCDLLLTLGEALSPAGENERVIAHVAPDAFTLAEALGDRSRVFHACRLAVDCLLARGGGIALRDEYVTWAERAAQYAAPESIERCHADLALATTRYAQGQFADARALRLDALALARRSGVTEAMFTAAYFHLAQPDGPRHWDERLHLAEECAGWPRQDVRSQMLGLALFNCGIVHVLNGDRARAEELWREVQELAERTRVVAPDTFLAAANAVLAILDGNLESALALLRPLVHARLGMATLLIPPVLYLGRADIWLSEFEEQVGLQSVARSHRASPFAIRICAAHTLCLAQVGRLEEARTVVRPLLSEVASGIDDETPFGQIALLLEAAVVLEERGAVRSLAARLTGVAHLSGDATVLTLVARHLGDAAALLGDRMAARAFFAQALESAGKLGFRPELALVHLKLAELLLQEGTKAARSEALTHLASAIPELRDMRMQPALERALDLSNKLQGLAVQATDAPITSVTLTTREREIACLVADGLTNRGIAERLVITEGTVKVHVKHILSKLGFRSRTEATVWLLRHQ